MSNDIENMDGEILAARGRLSEVAVLTPLVESAAINALVGGRVLLKLENLQHTGSFKFRGAYNKVASLSPGQLRDGIAATSSGNHAQAVAAVARRFGTSAVIGMPKDASPFKVARVRDFGASIVRYDRYLDDESAVAQALVRDHKATLIPPFDDRLVIAGQASVALELYEQAAARGVRIDAVIVPCGGGGLAAGTALATRYASPGTRMFIVEPEHYNDTALSLHAGTIVPNAMAKAHSTLCDALMSAHPGALTFAVNRRFVADAFTIADSHVREAVKILCRELRLIVEPSGAVGLAALLAGNRPQAAECVAVIVSGGNIALETLTTLTSEVGNAAG